METKEDVSQERWQTGVRDVVVRLEQVEKRIIELWSRVLDLSPSSERIADLEKSVADMGKCVDDVVWTRTQKVLATQAQCRLQHVRTFEDLILGEGECPTCQGSGHKRSPNGVPTQELCQDCQGTSRRAHIVQLRQRMDEVELRWKAEVAALGASIERLSVTIEDTWQPPGTLSGRLRWLLTGRR